MSESTVIAGELASFMCLLASTLLHSRDFKLQIFKKNCALFSALCFERIRALSCLCRHRVQSALETCMLPFNV